MVLWTQSRSALARKKPARPVQKSMSSNAINIVKKISLLQYESYCWNCAVLFQHQRRPYTPVTHSRLKKNLASLFNTVILPMLGNRTTSMTPDETALNSQAEF